MLVDPNQYRELATTPEQQLALAVILTAIEDLQSSDEIDRWEAHEFFLQPKGEWADMRRFYFDVVGVDHEKVHAHLVATLEPPERPDRKWTYEEIGDHLPRDRVFRTHYICDLTGLNHEQVHSRLQHLKRVGRVVQVDRGVYCHPDHEAAWRAKEAEKIETESKRPVLIEFKGFDAPPDVPQAGPTQIAILRALRDGRETIREIGFDVELGPNALKCALDRLIERGIVVKDGPRYRIVQHAAA